MPAEDDDDELERSDISAPLDKDEGDGPSYQVSEQL